MSRKFMRSLCVLVSLALGGMSLPMGVAHAAWVGTPAVLADQQVQFDRERLLSALARGEVQEQLKALGVDPAQAAERVAALTPEEIQALNARMAEMPAGGIDALGAVVFIFLVLLVTDILGFTNIFPFVNSR
jgi:hypothetical protein